MQDKIIIFGDSFADPADRKYENKNVTTWYEFLKSDYKITKKLQFLLEESLEK